MNGDLWPQLSWALCGLGRFIHDYQTLIAGVAAVAAAYYAARPVYLQLDMMRLQSDAIKRDMLLNREKDLRQALAALAAQIDKPLSDLAMAVAWDQGEKIDEQQAFYHDQHFSIARRWLERDYGWRESRMVESARSNLDEALAQLVGTLDDVHRPAHTDQADEDHAYSDEAWAAFLKRGEDAKDEVEDRLATAKRALTTMTNGIGLELRSIGRELTGMERRLSGLDRL